MPAKHPKKRSVVPHGEPATASPPPDSDVSAAELRAQMAILAEQVRHLGDRVERADDAWPAPASEPIVTQPPVTQPVVSESPPPIGSAVVEPAALSRRAHVVSAPLEHAPAPTPAHPGLQQPDVAVGSAAEHDETPIAELTRRLIESVLAMAERAADQIRESAEHEAARIRAGATSDPPATDRPTPDLPAPARGSPDLTPSQTGLEALEHQRQALAALAAETDRIEAAIERLRAQARALDAERQRLHEAIGAARRNA
jgi:hypothetical protein